MATAGPGQANIRLPAWPELLGALMLPAQLHLAVDSNSKAPLSQLRYKKYRKVNLSCDSELSDY